MFTGVGVALVTLFDDRAELDAPATAALAAQLVGLGVRSVVVSGTTGEAATLEAGERIALLDAVRDELRTAVPVIAGTGAPSARQAAALTRDATEHGADAVLVLSPPGASDTRPYYEAVGKAAAGTPVLAYHLPTVSPPGIAVRELADLPVAGVKDSAGDAERLLHELHEYEGRCTRARRRCCRSPARSAARARACHWPTSSPSGARGRSPATSSPRPGSPRRISPRTSGFPGASRRWWRPASGRRPSVALPDC